MGGQGGCERRIEVFVKIQKKMGGGVGGGSGGGSATRKLNPRPPGLKSTRLNTII